MKKNYSLFFALGIIAAISMTGYAQTDEQVSKKSKLTDEIQVMSKQTQQPVVVSN